MKILIKAFREGAGRLIILGDSIFSPKKVERSAEEQKIVDEKCKDLILYQFYACPFCIKVRRSMRRLRLDVETRSVSEGSPHREELLEGGGRVQAPCLCIKKDDKVEWLYESGDIIKYLDKMSA